MGGQADIIDMIAHRGDPEWDNTRRVYHPGTFNANPLSAVAGATCLEMVATQPINKQADAMAARLKAGLNEIFGKMEVAGHAHGIASMVHVIALSPLRVPEAWHVAWAVNDPTSAVPAEVIINSWPAPAGPSCGMVHHFSQPSDGCHGHFVPRHRAI